MYTNEPFVVNRGIVRSVDTTTGISQVELPAYLNTGGLIEVGNVGLTQVVPGTWDMPKLGSHVFLASDPRDRAFFISKPADVIAAHFIAAHLAATDPHGDRAFATTAANAASLGASVSLLAHVNAIDPHPQYINQTRLLTYPLGRHNLLDNGDFIIPQRGTSPRAVTAAGFQSDRWYFEPIAGRSTTYYPQTANGSFGRRLTSVVDVGGAGPYTPSASEYCRHRQQIPGHRMAALHWGTADAQPLTVSFETGAPAGFKFAVVCERPPGFTRFCSFVVTSLGLGVRQSVTFPGDTGGSAIAPDDAAGLFLGFYLAAGSSFGTNPVTPGVWTTDASARTTGISNIYSAAAQQFYMSQVQAEIGSVATPYEILPYETELATAQRFFQRMACDPSIPYTLFGHGYGISTTQMRAHINYAQQMRAVPTVTIGNATSFGCTNAGTVSAVSTIVPDTNNGSNRNSGLFVTMAAATLAANISSALHANNSTAPYIDISAEL